MSIPAARSINIDAQGGKAIEHMGRPVMLREITVRQCHRWFVYDAYLAIVGEGTEPIR